VARTIRTCSLVALVLAFAATPLAAQDAGSAALDAYVQGRLLDAAGVSDEAAIAYGVALTGAPTDERIATRAFNQAIEAGDRALALRAARALDAQGKLPGDGRLLLYIDAVSRNDWRGAGQQIAKMDGGNFDFLAPILRAWVKAGAREADPLAPLNVQPLPALTSAYSREQRIYLLLTLKNIDEAMATVRALPVADPRTTSIRITAASRLIALKDRESALNLVSATDPALVLARANIEAGRMPGQPITTAPVAAGVLLARLASDLLRDNAAATALRLARLGSFAAPDNAEVALVLAQALSAAGNQQAALATLDLWQSEPRFGTARQDLRFAAFQRLGRNDEALTLAEAAVAVPEANMFDHARLGDALSARKQFDRAALSYRKAIDLAEAGGGQASWALWLSYGGALDSAGDWPNAKSALQKAVAIDPEQPGSLNHLGYAMLERRDNLDEATRLIARAASLRPDDAAITDSLGWAFFLRGQTAESIAVLERAVASDPTIAELGEHLGDAYWKAGRKVDARYAWDAALIQAVDDEAVSTRIKGKIAEGLK
jgi:tetratricopeptide (TPR) repeat protein